MKPFAEGFPKGFPNSLLPSPFPLLPSPLKKNSPRLLSLAYLSYGVAR